MALSSLFGPQEYVRHKQYSNFYSPITLFYLSLTQNVAGAGNQNCMSSMSIQSEGTMLLWDEMITRRVDLTIKFDHFGPLDQEIAFKLKNTAANNFFQNIFKRQHRFWEIFRKSKNSPMATRSPSAIKEALLSWCQAKTRGYKNVAITNFSSSWADGMAFCALIHHFYPESFNFDELDAKNRAQNLKLAFETADKKADIMPLLEVEDMLAMGDKPDWKCIFTYVQCIYRQLRNQD